MDTPPYTSSSSSSSSASTYSTSSSSSDENNITRVRRSKADLEAAEILLLLENQCPPLYRKIGKHVYTVLPEGFPFAPNGQK